MSITPKQKHDRSIFYRDSDLGAKPSTREEIELKTKEFLNKGGKISKVKPLKQTYIQYIYKDAGGDVGTYYKNANGYIGHHGIKGGAIESGLQKKEKHGK